MQPAILTKSRRSPNAFAPMKNYYQKLSLSEIFVLSDKCFGWFDYVCLIKFVHCVFLMGLLMWPWFIFCIQSTQQYLGVYRGCIFGKKF